MVLFKSFDANDKPNDWRNFPLHDPTYGSSDF